MPLVAYDLSLDLLRSLRAPLGLVREANAKLADQLDRAADSVHLNLAEAGGRHGDDRTRLWRESPRRPAVPAREAVSTGRHGDGDGDGDGLR